MYFVDSLILEKHENLIICAAAYSPKWLKIAGRFFIRFALVTAVLISGFSAGVRAAEPITEQAAHAIGVQAYLYLYSLVTMDLTRKQLTNVERAEGLSAPMNTFANVPTFPTATMKAVVRPNFDTLYSSGWLDLTKEPMIVSAPDTNGRYYLLPMLDMWTDVFASPGWRTTGTEAGNFIVVPPGWRPDLRDRLIEEFKLPKDTLRIDLQLLTLMEPSLNDGEVVVQPRRSAKVINVIQKFIHDVSLPFGQAGHMRDASIQIPYGTFIAE